MAILTAGNVKPFIVQCWFAPSTLLLTVSFSQLCINSPSRLHNFVIKRHGVLTARAYRWSLCSLESCQSFGEACFAGAAHHKIGKPSELPIRTDLLSALWTASLVLAVTRFLDCEGLDGSKPVRT